MGQLEGTNKTVVRQAKDIDCLLKENCDLHCEIKDVIKKQSLTKIQSNLRNGGELMNTGFSSRNQDN